MHFFSFALLASLTLTAADIVNLIVVSKEGGFLGVVDKNYGAVRLTISLLLEFTLVHQNDTLRDNVQRSSHSWVSFEDDYLTFDNQVAPAEILFSDRGKMISDKKLWLCEHEEYVKKRADFGEQRNIKRSDEQPAANCQEIYIFVHASARSVVLEASAVEESPEPNFVAGLTAFFDGQGRSYFAATPGSYTPLLSEKGIFREMSAGTDSRELTVFDDHLAMSWDYDYIEMPHDSDNVIQLSVPVYACEGFNGANERAAKFRMIMVGDYSGFDSCFEVKLRVVDAAGNHVRQ